MCEKEGSRSLWDWMGGKRGWWRAITLNSGLCVCGQPEGGGGWLRRQNCACDPIVCLCACVRSICVGLWIVRGERDPMCEILCRRKEPVSETGE